MDHHCVQYTLKGHWKSWPCGGAHHNSALTVQIRS